MHSLLSKVKIGRKEWNRERLLSVCRVRRTRNTHAECDTADAAALCYDAVILPPNLKKQTALVLRFLFFVPIAVCDCYV